MSNEEVREEIEKDLDISDITAADLQEKIIAPNIIKEYREKVTKRMKDDEIMLILSGYTKSNFQDFESYLRTEIDWVEDDIRLVLNECNSSFITYKTSPGIRNFKDVSEALSRFLQSEYEGYHNAINIEFDDITMKTKLVVRTGIKATIFDEKSFFGTIFGFNHGWDYKHYNEYISHEFVNLGSTIKTHLRADVFDGSVVNGIKQPILYSFVVDKLPGYKKFCEPGRIHYKKNKSVLNTLTFYLEDNNNGEVDLKGETLTFTLEMIKI